MGLTGWFSEHWFDLLQTVGIVGGFAFTAHSLHKEAAARKINNLIAIKEQYREVWKELYERPALFRVLKKDVNLNEQPVSEAEWLFVKLLILHLDTVHRALKAGMFVKLEGLPMDVKDFLSLPIPKSVWFKMRPLQNRDFVKFVETSLNSNIWFPRG
jgi:hypothetical protein